MRLVVIGWVGAGVGGEGGERSYDDVTHRLNVCRHCRFVKPKFCRAKNPGERDAVTLHQAPPHRRGGAFPAGRIQRTGQPVDHLTLCTCTQKHM